MFNKLLTAAALSVVIAPAANAASTLVQYTTAGSTTSIAAGIVDANVVADDLVAGSGLGVQDYSTFNFNDWDVSSTSFEDAVAANDYWSFGFDVTSDINLTTMDIRLDRSGTGPDDFEIRATVNGSNELMVLSYNYDDSTYGVDFVGVDLSSISLSAGDSVEFILAAFNSESSGGTFDLETITYPGGTDSLTIYGDVQASVVPVPAAAFMFAPAMLGMLGFARRNHKA